MQVDSPDLRKGYPFLLFSTIMEADKRALHDQLLKKGLFHDWKERDKKESTHQRHVKSNVKQTAARLPHPVLWDESVPVVHPVPLLTLRLWQLSDSPPLVHLGALRTKSLGCIRLLGAFAMLKKNGKPQLCAMNTSQISRRQ